MVNALPEAHVLMPVYNTEPFVLASIQSVMEQTYPQVKLFLFNDGSTDGSLEKVKQYSHHSIFLKASKQNRGVTPVRRDLYHWSRKTNANAYIFWLDSDDQFTDPEFIEKVIQKMIETHSDICLYNFSVIYEDEQQKRNATGVIEDKKRAYTILRHIATSPNQSIAPLELDNLLDFTSLGCTKCYGPTITLPEPENCQFQDFVYMAALLNANRITALPPEKEPLQYLRRSDSLTGTRKPENFTDHIPKQLKQFFNSVQGARKLKMAEAFVLTKLAQYEKLLTQIIENQSHPNFNEEILNIYQLKSNELKYNIHQVVSKACHCEDAQRPWQSSSCDNE